MMGIKDEVLKVVEAVTICPICNTHWDGLCDDCEKCKLKEHLEGQGDYPIEVTSFIEWGDFIDTIDLTLAKVKELVEKIRRPENRKQRALQEGRVDRLAFEQGHNQALNEFIKELDEEAKEKGGKVE